MTWERGALWAERRSSVGSENAVPKTSDVDSESSSLAVVGTATEAEGPTSVSVSKVVEGETGRSMFAAMALMSDSGGASRTL